jgi:hypothetical protein
MGDALNDQPRRFVSGSVVVAHGEWGAVYKLNTKRSMSARASALRYVLFMSETILGSRSGCTHETVAGLRLQPVGR